MCIFKCFVPEVTTMYVSETTIIITSTSADSPTVGKFAL